MVGTGEVRGGGGKVSRVRLQRSKLEGRRRGLGDGVKRDQVGGAGREVAGEGEAGGEARAAWEETDLGTSAASLVSPLTFRGDLL